MHAEVSDTGALRKAPPESASATSVEPRAIEPPSAGEVLDALMARSMYANPAQSRETLHRALIERLVPDEARILAALSDGSVYPVIHVAEPGGAAWAAQNASTVGRAAGVSLPHHTPGYLTRLQSLGVVTMGPEVESMRDEYELLLTDAAVNAALKTARRGLRPPRIVRASVRMSDLGRDLWEAVT
ncbi:Abi-alpha family protein [Mycolicibacterium grossiae]|uniref:Abi-alpha family protein n=1 Tax=Mycolicibacterium grossiae TaxID=1552759 RepID=UPI0011F0AD69|nr:DUF4393 domain-containing protein [Mycolicibacterium grossiae]QEM44532.1 DUF4393 domain-containing protein [Mycolicibacterium grossiae]